MRLLLAVLALSLLPAHGLLQLRPRSVDVAHHRRPPPNRSQFRATTTPWRSLVRASAQREAPDSPWEESDLWFFQRADEAASAATPDVEQEQQPRAAAHGYTPFINTISQEYASLVQTQFDLLVTALDVARCALGFRKENPATGELEFATIAVYPPKKRVWVVDAQGRSEQRTGPLELPGYTSAAALLPQYPFVSVSLSADGLETSAAVENTDGGLSAPLIYGSLVIGMLTVWRDTPPGGSGSGSGDGGGSGGDGGGTQWRNADKELLEKVASSLAMGAALDQRQRWAAAAQVEELRRMLSETLHQAKNPLTALRTFGKLLLRRLPAADGLNRELAEDIILQSDRLVDLLLPVDDALGALAAAPPPGGSYYLPGGASPPQGELEGGGGGGQEQGAGGGGGWQSGAGELVFVQDAMEPVVRAAEAVAQASRVSFRWRVDDDLPGVYGNERALQEAVSNIVDNALKYVRMRGGAGEAPRDARPVVLLRVRLSTDDDWGASRGVVIEVCDNGPGIDPADLPRVFERGYRGGVPLRSGTPGTGLGLGIARDIMRAMGGDISINNR
ncbi:Two component sensor histidine kinase [Tribonema minus]|uniref:histidine kinase n=1 Tax=Tribonema minus TaxID=303371 RepID=A0A835ZFA0_9STRA|nr:Two component sensor histidine kinase [Tribonema minus]